MFVPAYLATALTIKKLESFVAAICFYIVLHKRKATTAQIIFYYITSNASG
jgi:hypothetical protein